MEMDDGEYDTGRPLTLDQLKSEFGDGRNFSLDVFLADGNTEPMEGAYRDTTFMIHEVKSAEELYSLMTWQGPRPNGGTVNFDYPDFVHADLQKSERIIYEGGYTAEDLPCRHGDNPTYRKYMDILGIGEGEDEYECSPVEKAIYDIQNALDADEDDDYDDDDDYDEDDDYEDDDYDEDEDEGYEESDGLTVDRYNEILKKHGLTDYVIEDGFCPKDLEDFESRVGSIPSNSKGMEQ